MIEEVGDVVLLLQPGCIATQHHGHHLILVIGHCSQCGLDIFHFSKRRFRHPCLVQEFVADVLV